MNFLNDAWEGTKQAVSSGADMAVQAAGAAGSAIGAATGMSYTCNLNGSEIVRLLAAAAEDVYTFDGAHTNGRLSLGNRQHEFFGSGNGLQFGIYTINGGSYNGNKICAFRGTDSFMGGVQDIDVVIGGSAGIIRSIISYACEHARANGADFICGHSLGGLIAECVCAHTGLRGAAFNAPGPWAQSGNSLVDGNSYNNVQFEIHNTKGDVVSLFGSAGGPDSSHIGKPNWHSHGGGHSMAALRQDIGNL